MKLHWPETRRIILPALQIFTGALTALASNYHWTLWWPFAVPWMILNLPGIILAIPVIAIAFLTAGVAHLDWRSESFFLGWFIAAPTILSLIICPVLVAWRRKRGALVRTGPLPAAERTAS